MRSHYTIQRIAIAALLALPGQAMALSGFSFEAGFNAPDVRWIEHLPDNIERRLRLLEPQDNTVDVESMIHSRLRESGLHPFIEVRTSSRALGLLTGSARQSARTMDFWFGGTRITGFGVKAVVLPGQTPGTAPTVAITGNLPVMDQSAAIAAVQQLGDWPRRENALAVAQDTMRPGSGPIDDQGQLIATQTEPVFYATTEGIVPAWQFVILINGLPWEVVSDEREILAFNPRYFDIVQTAVRSYKKNKTDGELKDFPVSISDGTTHLENSSFKTDMQYPGESRATMTSDRFDFATSSAQFRESGIFAHANEHLDYLVANGYRWTSDKAITLRVAECVDSTCSCTPGRMCSSKSNGYYTPSDSQYDGPSIRIGEGDGILLKDLHYDSDVVSHEFGHHVIVASIKNYNRNSEALQLHEGLADTLVMMKTGSPCLGAGICPAGTNSMCYTSQCLRTADNDMTYGSTAFLAGADHQKGQLISGLVWDIKKSGVSTSDLTRIVLGAIDLLPDNARFGDFTMALRTADKSLFDGAHLALIEQYIIARNLDDATASATSGSSSDAPARKKSVGGFFGCTVMAAGNNIQPKAFPVQGMPPDGPMQLGIYVHDAPGIRDHSSKDHGFDVLLALLLAAPILVAVRRVARRAAGKGSGNTVDAGSKGHGRLAP